MGQRFALITYHGSVVHLDRATRTLRHAPIWLCDPNVWLTRDGATAELTFHDGAQERVVDDYRPDVCGIAATGGSAELGAVSVGTDLLALHIDGRYMCAEASGAIAMSRNKPKDWESFLLVPEQDMRRLAFVLTNRWLPSHADAPTNPGAYRCAEPYSVLFDGMTLPVRALAGADDAPSPVLFLCHDDWKIRHYVLYRPLVYLAAFGRHDIFQSAEIAIRSLFDHGQWDGDVLLITDAEHRDFPARLPAAMRARTIVAIVPAHDVLDYTLARYKVVDLPEAAPYQPILYIDTDIVCDAPLHALTRATLASPQLHACPEFPLGRPGDFYGQSMLTADGVDFDPAQPGFSSGTLAFRDVETQRTVFRTIVATAYRVASLADRRDVFEYFDQPIFNYVTYKARAVSGSLLENFLRIYINNQPPLTEPVGKGLVHFAGGVGNAEPKLTHMMRYLELLNARR